MVAKYVKIKKIVSQTTQDATTTTNILLKHKILFILYYKLNFII